MSKKLIIILVAIFGLGTFNSNAQNNVKFAHADYMKVIESLPAMTNAQREVELYQEQKIKTLQDLEIEIQRKYQSYLDSKETNSDIVNQLTEKDISEDQEILEKKSQSAQQDIEIYSQSLFKPIQDSLLIAIENIAEKHKVTYMFDSSSMLYVDPNGGLDLTEEVRVELIRLLATPVTTGGTE